MAEAERPKSRVACRAYGRFVEWLAGSGGSVAVTTYNSGRLLVLASAEGQLRWRAWRFERPMGLAVGANRAALATRGEVLRFSAKHTESGGRLRQVGLCETGRVDTHEVTIVGRRVLFANTRSNCVARAKPGGDYSVRFRPSFVDPELRRDQCHLNGLGVRDGELAAVTLFGRSNQPRGWRTDARFSSGELMAIADEGTLAGGLCMPHSPRWHDGCWWLCDSGRGTLCRVSNDEAEPVAELPGFTRGLCIVDGHALVGRSRFRDEHVLDTKRITGRTQTPRSGVSLVELASGEEVGGVDFLRGGREVFEVTLLPGLPRPRLVLPPGLEPPQPGPTEPGPATP